ncbi:uncharacterized protein METZ01_LOCUS228459 [marine metagenome]|uniref:Uncharacterized protein n=1 Tax=marine metagenome TaxID=408172 RepID=A0A382GLG5_9ZZZZ
MKFGKMAPINIMALGLSPATKKPSRKKDIFVFE